MSEQVTFDFGEHGISRPEADGIYRGDYFYGESVAEPEAIRQWLCSVMNVQSPEWPYIERLVDLAETNAA